MIRPSQRIFVWRQAPLLLLLAATAGAQSLAPGAGPKPREPSQVAGQVAPKPAQAPKTPATPEPPEPVDDTLEVGDKAPRLEALRWVKGDPVTEWKPGVTYVVEFWAPWCPWCRESLPLYAEIARSGASKNVKVVAVAVWPKKSLPEMAEDFVADQAEAFPYPVALDVEDRAAKAWLDAADKLIPMAFVVDGDGRIRWMGDPRQGLEKALSKDRAPAPYVEVRGMQEDPDVAAGNKAYKDQDWKTLAEVSRRLYDKNPWSNAKWAMDHYIALVRLGENEAAKEWGERLYSSDFSNQFNGLNILAWYIVEPGGAIPREQQDLELALKAATRADKLSMHMNPYILDTLARVKFLRGEVAEALRLQLKAVENAKGLDSRDAPEIRKELAERLDEYQAACEQAGDDDVRP